MKLRIRGNSLRLRLTRTEVADFGQSGCVTDEIVFGPGQALRYSLRRSDESGDIVASFADGRIDVCVPTAAARSWATSEAVSLRAGEADDGEPTVLIEKDFACLVEREGEDDSDAYPHPKAEAASP